MQNLISTRSLICTATQLLAVAMMTSASFAAPSTQSTPAKATPAATKPATKPTAAKPTGPKPAAPATTADAEKREPYQPSFSADGKQVVYVERIFPNERSFEPHSHDIWTLNIAIKMARRVTQGKTDEHPRFSPDGQSIVFARDDDIWTVNTDGTGLKNVTNTPKTDENYPDFANDGESIFFVRFYEGNEEDEQYFGPVLYSRNLDDGTERVILDDDYSVMQVVPNRADAGRIYVECKRLAPNGKPVDYVTIDDSVAEFTTDGTWIRTLYTPKQGADKENSGEDIGTIRAMDGGILLNVSRSLDLTTYLLTSAGMKKLPDVSLVSDITHDGRQTVATRAPRGSLVQCLQFYDIATGKSTLLRLGAPVKKTIPAPPTASTPVPVPAPVPATAGAFVERAKEHYQAGRYDESLSDYSQALRLEPAHAPALLARARVKELQADFDGALADYEAALRIDKKLVQAHINRAFLLNARGRSGEAIDGYSTAIALDPRNVEALLLRGEAYAARLETAEAIADFDAVLQLDPEHVPALLARGTQFLETGDRPAALADFNRAITLHPRNIRAFRKRAELHRKMGNNEAAAADEQKAKELAAP